MSLSINGALRRVLFPAAALLTSACLGPVSRGSTSSLAHSARSLSTSHQTFAPPLKTFRVGSPYGRRGKKFHEGVDLVDSPKGGEPVLASMEGVVEKVSHRGSYGRMILLSHGKKGFTRYAHLKKTLVREGQTVQQGETIGFVGKSGRATGYHLHFEILTAEQKTVDPMPYLFPEDKSVHLTTPSAPRLPSPEKLTPKIVPPIGVPQNVK